MPSVTQTDAPVEIEVTCTAVGGGNSTLTPRNPSLGFATTIVVNGNASFLVGKNYTVTVKSF